MLVFLCAMLSSRALPTVDWSPGAELVATVVIPVTGTQDRVPEGWRPGGGQPAIWSIHSLTTNHDETMGLARCEYDRTVATVLLRLPDGVPIAVLSRERATGRAPTEAAFSTDGRLLAILSGAAVEVWHLPELRLKVRLPASGLDPNASVPVHVGFGQDAQRLVGVTNTGVCIWEATAEPVERRWRVPEEVRVAGIAALKGIQRAAMAPEADVVAVASGDLTMVAYSISRATQIGTVPADATRSIWGDGTGKGGPELDRRDGASGPMRGNTLGFALLGDGREAALVRPGGDLILASFVDAATQLLAQRVGVATFSPDGGHFLASAAMHRTIPTQRLWSIEGDPAWSSFSASGRWLIAGVRAAPNREPLAARVYRPAQ